jgi:Ca-activated chloride channel family protein
MSSTRPVLLVLLSISAVASSGCGDAGDWYDDPYNEHEHDANADGFIDEIDDPAACNEADEVVLYLSPDDSNSTSSPAQVEARVLDEGQAELRDIPIRKWEFMNYYEFAYPPAEDGTLAAHAAMQPMEGFEDRYRLQLAITSESMLPEERPRLNLTLVMDTSGSMDGKAIELLRETGKVIAGQLREGDTVSMVEWDTQNTWVLSDHAVSGPDDPEVVQAIDALDASGGTDLNAGLISGYELAQEVFDPQALNRLVLISDGGANAGVVDPELIGQNAVYGGADGIYLVGVGVHSGWDSYDDELMDVLTDLGKGASLFIDSAAEANEMFGDRFLETMAIAARNVQVELTMPPGFEIVKFSGEEFSADPEAIEPQHIAPNDAMVFHQQVQTCAPDELDAEARIAVEVTWQDPWSFETRSLTQDWTFGELRSADPALLLEGAAVLAYAEALSAYPTQGSQALLPAIEAVDAARAEQPEDEDLATIAAILDAL